ncbi:MAG: threonine--tRNA ligase [Clostridia bacterium]|nr:threonine--tRNA ligase [Clostridia bacterium]
MNITFPDGNVRTYENGMSGFDIANSISPRLAKATLCCTVDGERHDAFLPLENDCAIKFCTFDDPDGRWTYRHTAAHVMAQAVKRLFPNAKLAIGPAIENGFYYDFDIDEPFTPDDLLKIEKEMERVSSANYKLERFELPRKEAIEFCKSQDEPYKVELIEDLPEDAVISFYRQGDFTDLCAGPHLPSTSKVKNFKLMSVAGAYWRGSEKNKMLQRIYGTAFEKKSDLEAYITALEEAKRRDHRKLGKELGLFALMDEGPGFPFFLPKGMVLRNELIDYWREAHRRYGYVEISTPMILSRSLWETSGHWSHYKDNMYTTEIDEGEYAIKPMNCPGGMLVYRSEMRSYRDLPLRMGELGLVHRHELSGALHGLFRVRCFTQDDAHIFMTWEQMKDEIKNVVRLFDEVYSTFGLAYKIELSTMPEDHMGEKEVWDLAIETLREAITELEKPFEVNEGDGAFYGPKLDFHLSDCLGRTWQCGTIQLDMQLPERFELEYTGADGQKHRPVMIHRALFGSIERFIGVITEHFAGAFPTWLAPVQVKVLPITDRAAERCKEVTDRLNSLNIRTEIDLRNEKIGFKIREAQLQKIPYMLVLGDKEVEQNLVAVRSRKDGDLGTQSLDSFIERVQEEISTRAL